MRWDWFFATDSAWVRDKLFKKVKVLDGIRLTFWNRFCLPLIEIDLSKKWEIKRWDWLFRTDWTWVRDSLSKNDLKVSNLVTINFLNLWSRWFVVFRIYRIWLKKLFEDFNLAKIHFLTFSSGWFVVIWIFRAWYFFQTITFFVSFSVFYSIFYFPNTSLYSHVFPPTLCSSFLHVFSSTFCPGFSPEYSFLQTLKNSTRHWWNNLSVSKPAQGCWDHLFSKNYLLPNQKLKKSVKNPQKLFKALLKPSSSSLKQRKWNWLFRNSFSLS